MPQPQRLSTREYLNRSKDQPTISPLKPIIDALGGVLYNYINGGVEPNLPPLMTTRPRGVPQPGAGPIVPDMTPSVPPVKLDDVLKQFMTSNVRSVRTSAVPSLEKLMIAKDPKGYTINAKGRPRVQTQKSNAQTTPSIDFNMSRDEAMRRMLRVDGAINTKYKSDSARRMARAAMSQVFSQFKSLKPEEIGAWVDSGFGKGTLLTSAEDVYGGERAQRLDERSNKNFRRNMYENIGRAVTDFYRSKGKTEGIKEKDITKLIDMIMSNIPPQLNTLFTDENLTGSTSQDIINRG